jgi:hypothetical protein
VILWLKGARKRSAVIGGNGLGKEANHLNYPISLLFDRETNLIDG